MIRFKIHKEDLNDFYQSKFEYFKVVSGFSAILIGILEMSYFISDCQLFGRIAYETILPRFFIIVPLLVFLFFYPRVNNYKKGVILYYIMPHAAMWCTIWAIYYLPTKDFAREGFIIMHFAFMAIGFAMPIRSHILIHGCLLLNIIISNLWNHYEYFPLMISLALPLYIGVVIMLLILENSYGDHYLVKKELEKSSVSDELTGAYNRYKLSELLDSDTEKLVLDKDVIALMLDIDFFKKVNDTYGHSAGDEILKFVAKEINDQLYARDYLIRWGGEEFVILLVDYSLGQALQFAEKIRYKIESTNNDICPITISIGVRKIDKDETFHSAIKKADQALYYAKNHGRNQVVNYNQL